MKKYQVTSQVLIAADGWVRAKNIDEAKKKWEEFCQIETGGLSFLGVEINEVISPQNKYYDKDNIPTDEEFENKDGCITHNYLN